MGFLDFFRPLKAVKQARWKELGVYTARFTSFGADMYRSDLVRSCIRPIAEHSSKASAVCTDKRIERILNVSPNLYMNGKDFLAKIRTQLELRNTAFIYIQRDTNGLVTGFYPIPYRSFEGIDYNGNLYVQFTFASDVRQSLTLSWKDLAVLRKDYNKSDIAGDSNDAILNRLELINTTNEGIANAVKATANLRGILKSTKAMLSREDIAKQKEQFVHDYLNLANEGGIASLDATQEFTPITMSPTVTGAETLQEFREDVYRYFGISDAIIKSDFTEAQMEAFYDARIEPFLVALSIELTRKVFTDRQQGFGNQIVYESNRINFASTATKLNMIQLVDRGILTPNELRAMFNLAPVIGGDIPIRRLDTRPVTEDAESEINETEDTDELDNNGED